MPIYVKAWRSRSKKATPTEILLMIGIAFVFFALISPFGYMSFGDEFWGLILYFRIPIFIVGILLMIPHVIYVIIRESKKNKSAYNKLHPQETPTLCPVCNGNVVNRRCVSCKRSWCNECGTWNDARAEDCIKCNKMLPP